MISKFFFREADLLGVGSIIGQTRMNKIKPATTIPITNPIQSKKENFSFLLFIEICSTPLKRYVSKGKESSGLY